MLHLGNGHQTADRLVLMSVTQSMMDIGTLCAMVTFTELDADFKKVAQVQHRSVGCTD